jgi:hypothetical protein
MGLPSPPDTLKIHEGRPVDFQCPFYRQVFCHEKQENAACLQLHACPSVIPAWCWPESRDVRDGVDSGLEHARMTEQHAEVLGCGPGPR